MDSWRDGDKGGICPEACGVSNVPYGQEKGILAFFRPAGTRDGDTEPAHPCLLRNDSRGMSAQTIDIRQNRNPGMPIDETRRHVTLSCQGKDKKILEK